MPTLTEIISQGIRKNTLIRKEKTESVYRFDGDRFLCIASQYEGELLTTAPFSMVDNYELTTAYWEGFLKGKNPDMEQHPEPFWTPWAVVLNDYRCDYNGIDFKKGQVIDVLDGRLVYGGAKYGVSTKFARNCAPVLINNDKHK